MLAPCISNGSGLFDANRISAHTLVKTLLHAYRDPATGSVFVEQLAVGGVDGTLKHRFAAFKKYRSVHAKTGTLDTAIALSGFAFRPDGSSPVAFSLIVSCLPGRHAEVRKRIDEIVSSVARTIFGSRRNLVRVAADQRKHATASRARRR